MEHKITPTEEALIYLADVVERMPHCEYRVTKDILDILGIEFVAAPSPN